MRRALLASTALALLVAPAPAQESRAVLEGQVTSGVIDNQAMLIPPKTIRNILLDILASVPTLVDNPGTGSALLTTNNVFTGSNTFNGGLFSTNAMNGTQQNYWGESGGSGLSSVTSPLFFDLSNFADTTDRAIECVSFMGTSVAVRNKGCISINTYSPQDNGGDASGIYSAVNGGAGNAGSFFTTAFNISNTIFSGYIAGTTLTVTAIDTGLNQQPLYPTENVWTAVAVASGTYNGGSGAVSLTTASATGIASTQSFQALGVTTSPQLPIQSLLIGTQTATSGSTGTTLNYVAPTSYGTATIGGGYIGVPIVSSLTITSQSTGMGGCLPVATATCKAGGVGTYVLSANAGTVGSAGSPATFAAQLPQYLAGGFTIEAQADAAHNSLLVSAVNGGAIIATSNGAGPALNIFQSRANTPPTAPAIALNNPANNGTNFQVNYNGDMFTDGNFNINADVNTTTSPSIAGWTFVTNTSASQFQLMGPSEGIQAGAGYRVQLYNFWGVEIRGDSESSTPPAYAAGAGTDASLTIIGTHGDSANALDLYNNAASVKLASITATGDIVATLPSSAGSGGLYVCADNTGKFYQKSSCP